MAVKGSIHIAARTAGVFTSCVLFYTPAVVVGGAVVAHSYYTPLNERVLSYETTKDLTMLALLAASFSSVYFGWQKGAEAANSFLENSQEK